MSIVASKKQFECVCNTVGLEVDGPQPVDPQIKNPQRFYRAFAKNPYLAMGESYVAGHYEVDDLFSMVKRFYEPDAKERLKDLLTVRQKLGLFLYHICRRLINANARYAFADKRGQSKITEVHYDIDNALMLAMLGPSKKYTSGYWKPQYGPYEHDTAEKLDLEVIAQRIGLQPGMRVLDIGFGYGLNTKYLVEKYGVEVTGLTISKEQLRHAEFVCKDISDKVTFVLADWRDVNVHQLGQFNRVISLEMIESIGGPKNYYAFFKFISDALREDGSVLIQAINVPQSTIETNPWIEKYIFPNGVLPTPQSMQTAASEAGLHLRLVDNTLGWANGQTCLTWWRNTKDAWSDLIATVDATTGKLKEEKYKYHFKHVFPYPVDEHTFLRTWQFYLVGCAAAHLSGYVDDGHFVWEKNPSNVSQTDIHIPRTKQEVDAFLSNQ